MDKVYLQQCPDYEMDRLVEAVDRLFSQLGVYDDLKPGMTALLKPNLVMRSKPEEAVATHPALTAAVGLCVKKTGARVLIAESGGGPFTPATAKGAFAACGYEAIAKEYGFELYIQCKSKLVPMENARLCRQIDLLEPFLEGYYLINLAKMKTHCMMGFSGAVKNLFGAVPGLGKPELHCRFPEKEDFAQMLTDLCQFLSPDLSIIDGIWAMEGDGPTGGKRKDVGLLLAARNPWVLDVAAETLAGMDPETLPLTVEGAARGLGPKDAREIQLVGGNWSFGQIFTPAKSSSTDFLMRLPAFLRPLAQKITTPLPKIDTKHCVGCGKCAESCPQHTITIEKGKAHINYKQCIHCFCCHEMCPKHVINIKRFQVFRF